MDGPNVNLKFYEELVKKKQEIKLHSFIDFGSCNLHIVHGNFRTGAEASGWQIKSFLKSIYQILHDTPARREDYQNVTGCNVFPLMFCATRYEIYVSNFD